MAEAAFGVELRRSRQAAALSLRQLAGQVGYDHSYLSQVERGQRPGSAHLAQLCDQALGTGTTLATVYHQVRAGQPATAATGSRPARTAPATGSSGPEAVPVTAFAAAAAAAAEHAPALAPGPSLPPGLDRLEATRQALAGSLGQVPELDEWTELVDTYARDYLIAPPGDLLTDLSADLELLRATAGAATARTATALAVPGARLAVLMALTLAGLGRGRAAGRWWRTARDTAERSVDHSTRSLVRSWEAVTGLSERQPPAESVTLAEQALALADQPGDTAQALAARAQTLGQLGRAEEAQRSLQELAATVAELPGELSRDASLFGWAPYKLHYIESHVYTALEDTARALEAKDRALDLCPPEHRRERAELELYGARCLVYDEKVAAGLAVAMRVLVELPDEWHTEFLYDAGGRVLSAVPAVSLGRPAIRDYRELLLRRPYQQR